MKTRVTTSQRYVFNGQEYHSLEAMPPEVRKFFEDTDRNGIPDGMDALMGRNGREASALASSEHRVEHVQVTTSDDDLAAPPLPGEVRLSRASTEPHRGLQGKSLLLGMVLAVVLYLLWRVLF